MATAPVTVNANLNFNAASVRAAGNKVQSAFGNINLPSKAVNNFNNSLGRITGQASEFDKSINAATARVFAFGAAVSIINGISTAFKGLISSTIEVEKRLTEIGSIIGVSVDQLGRFKTAIFDVAKNTGQTFDTVANGAAELARQGLSAEETVKRLNSALILTRVSGLDAESSVSALTAAINGFASAGLTAEQIINKLIAVDTAFAVSAKDLAEAFSRAGSTAEDAGVSFDQLLGLVTAVQQTTARGGAVIGNAFKSIFARLGRGTVIEDLKALGVEIDQSQTGVQKLQALATALANISDPTKANAIKELAGGVFQINIVSAALKDLSNETSIFARASEIAGQASNEAFQKNAQLNQTLAAQINSLVQGLTELGSKIGELTLGPVIQNLLTGANKLLDILNKVFDPEEGNKLIQGFFKGVGAFISGPGLILVSAAFFKLFQVVAKFAAQGVSDLFKIGSEQEKIKNIEGGIVALLQQDANLRATLLSTSATQAQKEQAVINAIKQQNTLLTQQQQLVNSIASAAARAGVGGFTATGGFTKKSGKGKFAAGYMEEEAMARSLGATSSVKAKMGKGTIDGQKFIMNNQEVEIPNFAGGRDSAVIPLYARGFVSNFNKFSTKSPNYFTEKQRSKLRDDELDDFDKALLAKKQKQEERLPITANHLKPFPFLIPSGGSIGSLSKKTEGTALSFGSKYPYKIEREGIIPFSFPNLLSGNVDIADDPYDTRLEEKITNEIANASFTFAKLLDPPSKNLSTLSDINERLNKQGGGKGAIISAVGAAFEAAVSSALGIESMRESTGGADFDVPSSTIPDTKKLLSQLFNIGKFNAAEFKSSGSEGNINSYIGKIIKANKLGFKQKEPTKTPKKASGFIPNFAAVNDAISREMEAGVPRDKIYVDQNSSLKSSLNPEGIMVANTIDEPNGGIQGIKRAKREGKNPKTYGQNFAARGFVPNFFNFTPPTPAGNLPAAAQAAAASKEAVEATKKVTQALNGLDDAAKNTTKLEDEKNKSMAGAIGVAFAFSMVMSTALPYIQQFAQTMRLDEEALKRETEARNKAVKSLEEEKNKGAKANAESIESIEAEILTRDESIAAIEEEAVKFAGSVAGIVGGIITFGSTLSVLAPTILSTLTAIKTAGGVSAALSAAGVSSGFQKAGVAAAAAAGASFLLNMFIDYLIKNHTQKLNNVASEYKFDIMQINLGRLSTDIAKIQLVIDSLGEASKEGYQTIKLAAEGMRSEFQRLNDEIGVSGASSKITQAEGLDKIISGGKDFITQQNLKKTRDPFEQQRIVKNRQEDKAGPEADRELERSRAKVALDMKGAQEDLFTALKPYLNEGAATSATADAAISGGRVPQGVFSKDNPYGPKPADPTGPAFSITEPELSVNETDFDRSPVGVAMRAARQREIYDEKKNRERVFESGNAIIPPDYINANQEERMRKTSKGEAGILERDEREADSFAKKIGKEFSTSSNESQTELLKAFRAYDEASENLKNTTSGVGASGNIVSDQEVNMKQFSDTRDALKALIQQRAESSGGDVEAVTEAFDENSARFEAGVKAQTDAFIKDQLTKKQIELDSLQQQKEVLDQFIDNFNASFLQNAERGADLFAEAMASGSGTRIQENIAQLQGASLGTGMAGSSDVFAQRQEALIQMMSSLESSGFFQSVGTGEEQAKFRSQFAGQVLGGGEITALQGALGAQSGNLQKQLSGENADGTPNVLGRQINSDPNARTAIADSTLAFKEILTKLREAAVAAGDTNLTADVDKRLATLSDPNATAQQKIAAGNIGLEGTKLDDTTQTEFQKQLISAGGAIQSVIDLLKGESVANATNDLGIKIEENVKSLETLRKLFDTTAEDFKLPTIVASMTTSSEGFKEIIENLKESATGFKQELDSLKEGINVLRKNLGNLNEPSTTMKTDLDNLARAAKAAEVALKSITPTAGNSGGEVGTDTGPKTAGPAS